MTDFRRWIITFLAALVIVLMTGCAKHHPCISVDGNISCYGRTFSKKEALDVGKAVGTVTGADGYSAVKDDKRYRADKGSPTPAPAPPAASRPRPDSNL